MTDREMLDKLHLPLNEAMHGPGAFLTAGGKNCNSMIIGWSTVGRVWRMPIVTVLVRYSRYTHDFMEKCDHFTLSIPHSGQMKDAIRIMGTQSGRDLNKYEAAGLSLAPAKHGDTPIITGCKLYAECRTVYKQSMDPTQLDAAIKKTVYLPPANPPFDYHTVYYGLLLDVYEE